MLPDEWLMHMCIVGDNQCRACPHRLTSELQYITGRKEAAEAEATRMRSDNNAALAQKDLQIDALQVWWLTVICVLPWHSIGVNGCN